MKTVLKITAIAVITVLAVLACSDDVSPTARDYSELKDSNHVNYTNSYAQNEPTFQSYLAYKTNGSSDREKEVDIKFPDYADILKENDKNIDAKLHEFLSFSKYRNPDKQPLVYTPSELYEPVTYEFARRTYTDSSNIVTIRFPTQINNSRIICKLDASKYKVYGQLQDFNVDGISGQNYDDIYYYVNITGGAVLTGMWSYDFFPPVVTINLNLSIGGVTGGSLTSTDQQQYLTLYDSSGRGDDNAQTREILDIVKNKIEFQKYNEINKKWEKNRDVGLYEYKGTVPAGYPDNWTSDRLFVNPTLDDFGIYRIKATDIDNLYTDKLYGIDKAKLKISFTGGTPGPNTPFAYRYKEGYSEPVSYYNQKRKWITSITGDSSTLIHSDADKRNVVLTFFYRPVQDDSTDKSYLLPISLEAFNACARLVYSTDGSTLPIRVSDFNESYDKIAELKIIKVEYKASRYYDVENSNINSIEITLDPSYQIHGNREINLLLNPGFRLSSDLNTFGNPDPKQSYYKGTFFWRNYGSMGTFRL